MMLMPTLASLRNLAKLTWLEIKIFAREPMGLIGSVAIPVGIFVVLGRPVGSRLGDMTSGVAFQLRVGLPVFAAIFIASLVRTARFAPPLGRLILYSMLPFCGLFRPIDDFPAGLQMVSRAYADPRRVSALRHLARQLLVSPFGRRRGTGRRICGVHVDRVAGVPVGVTPA